MRVLQTLQALAGCHSPSALDMSRLSLPKRPDRSTNTILLLVVNQPPN